MPSADQSDLLANPPRRRPPPPARPPRTSRWPPGCDRGRSPRSWGRSTSRRPAICCRGSWRKIGSAVSSSYGPPGTGKTSLAEAIAAETKSRFVRLNAVMSNVAELRDILATARRIPEAATILFIDELHRFNKAQQDLLLPDVEEGCVRLIGATTHNPGFYVNRRCFRAATSSAWSRSRPPSWPACSVARSPTPDAAWGPPLHRRGQAAHRPRRPLRWRPAPGAQTPWR